MSSWTDNIPNGTLCGYFYIFFVIFSIIAALSVISGIWAIMSSKLPAAILSVVLFTKFLSFGISATSALFLYLICERALKPAMKAQYAQNDNGSIMVHDEYAASHAPHDPHSKNMAQLPF